MIRFDGTGWQTTGGPICPDLARLAFFGEAEQPARSDRPAVLPCPRLAMAGRMTLRVLILAVLAIAALFWARVVYGLIFRDNGARPGDPSWSEPYEVTGI